jgi:single-stranded DNA-binding protein
MAYVRIEQRNGRLATEVIVNQVSTREGPLAKATVVVISNGVRNGESEATAIRWTVWSKQAENAARYLGKGSRVNVVGSLRNNNYDKDGVTVYSFDFTAEEIDYLDSRGERDARSEAATQPPAKPETKATAKGRAGKPGAPVTGQAYGDSDVPF